MSANPIEPNQPATIDRMAGVLLGTAVGDALGLPAEGLSPRRRRRLFPGPWRHRWCWAVDCRATTPSMPSSLCSRCWNVPTTRPRFSGDWPGLTWWFASLPAGIRRATARACIKLWLGFPPTRSGVFSAGNGPAMAQPRDRRVFSRRSRRTGAIRAGIDAIDAHRSESGDSRTCRCAVARWAVEHQPHEPPQPAAIVSMLAELAPEDRDWQAWIGRVPIALAADKSVVEFAAALGLDRGVTGYIYHTVPIAAYAWLRHYGDFRAMLEACARLRRRYRHRWSDRGGLGGATVGGRGIPPELLEGIVDWPALDRSDPPHCRAARAATRGRSTARPNILFLAGRRAAESVFPGRRAVSWLPPLGAAVLIGSGSPAAASHSGKASGETPLPHWALPDPGKTPILIPRRCGL